MTFPSFEPCVLAEVISHVMSCDAHNNNSLQVLAVRQGELDLHGRPRNVTWVQLAQTANKNSSLLHVLEPVDWLPGDQIVIASTTKDGNETKVSCHGDD